MERLYCGSPRWRNKREVEHTRNLFDAPATHDLNREALVVEAIENAWGKGKYPSGQFAYDASGSPYQEFVARSEGMLATCTQPACSRRFQQQIAANTDLPSECTNCGKPLRYDFLRPIENKWVYVFKGGSVEDEMFAGDASSWLIWNKPGVQSRAERDFESNPDRLAPGSQYYGVDTGCTYQFFVSPVQLSKKALQDLSSAASQSSPAPPQDPANERSSSTEQLDEVTVRRQFFKPDPNDEGPRTEIVPVMDAWSWLEEVNEWDYRPILEAQFRFLMDANERSKLNIAVILDHLVAPVDGKSDQFNIAAT